MDKLKKFKNYIAGFRSGNPANERKAKIYYIFMVTCMVVGSSWRISDFALLGMLLIAPSVFYNFKSMIKNKKEYGRASALTLALFIVMSGIFDATCIESNYKTMPELHNWKRQ